MQQNYRDEGIKTACLVPLVSHDQALGVIGLYHTRDREWPDDEVALAQSFANQAAVALENFRSKFNVPLGVESQGFCVLG